MGNRLSMHDNSLEAYESIRATLKGRQLEIWQILWKTPHMTDREILMAIGGTEMNQVRPRITELLKKDLIRETGSRICFHTGKKCRTLALKKQKPQMELDLL